MKKLIVIVAVAVLVAAAGMAKADTMACSQKTTADRVLTTIEKENVRWIGENGGAVITVTARDENGVPMCDAMVSLSTSRNQPGTGWEPNVDELLTNNFTTDDHGVATFFMKTAIPAGTTITATINNEPVKEVPFFIGFFDDVIINI